MNRGIKSFGRHLSCLTSLAGRMPAGIVVCMIVVAGLFAASTPAQAQSQENLVDRVSKAVGASLPDKYQAKVKEFVRTDRIMKDEASATFTEQFIQEQMKENWGISKQNQLLFIWDAIYEQITNKDFLDYQEDGYEKWFDDLDKTIDTKDACGKKYRREYIDLCNRRSAEAKQKSAEATKSGLNELIRFYNYYKENPKNVKSEDIKLFKENSTWIISNCKKYGIDYKSKLTPEMLRFYGVE